MTTGVDVNNNLSAAFSALQFSESSRLTLNKWSHPNHWDESLISNATFKLKFDVPTPRPHFIILYGAESSPDISIDRVPYEDVKQLLHLVDKFRFQFDLTHKPMQLSFHTGSWSTMKNMFHAHLCVDKADYLRILHDFNLDVEDYKKHKKWPAVPSDANPLTAQHQSLKARYVELIEQADSVCAQTTRAFVDTELDTVLKQPLPCDDDDDDDDFLAEESELFDVFFDAARPYVHFVAKPPALDANNNACESAHSRADLTYLLLREMCALAHRAGLFGQARGAHLCVGVNDAALTCGWLVLAVDDCYRLNPRRDAFLRNFMRIRSTYRITT